MKVHDRSAKVNRRRTRQLVHGIAMKRLLVERQAKVQREAQEVARVAALVRPEDSLPNSLVMVKPARLTHCPNSLMAVLAAMPKR